MTRTIIPQKLPERREVPLIPVPVRVPRPKPERDPMSIPERQPYPIEEPERVPAGYAFYRANKEILDLWKYW